MFGILAMAVAISGTFTAQDHKDAISDAVSVLAVLGDKRGGVAIGCEDTKAQKLVATVPLPNFVGIERAGILAGGINVQYRFDDDKPVDSQWEATGHQIIWRWNTNTGPVDFIRRLKTSTKLHVRVWKSDGNPEDIAFNYAAPAVVVDRVLARCGYDAATQRVRKWNG